MGHGPVKAKTVQKTIEFYEKPVRVAPSQRVVEQKTTGEPRRGMFDGLRRKRRPASGTEKVEQFAKTYEK